MDEVSVLVVDDQAVFRDVMAAVVAATDGFRLVGSVASGEEAEQAARSLRPRLVLMDVHLPGADGVETSRRLTAAGGGPVVVLVSTDDRLHIDLAACGAAAYLPKEDRAPDRLTAAWDEHRVTDPAA